MGELLKNFDRFMIVDFMPSYLKKKVPDCTLYSGDGHQFQIHKEIFCQTNLMLAILSSASRCCDQMEILIPSIGKNDLEQVVNFLYSGQIPVENEKNLIENLVRVFGFAENLKIVGSNPVKEVKEEFVIKLKTEIKTEEQATSKESFDPNEETGMDFITSEEFDKNLKNASNFNEKYKKKNKKKPEVKVKFDCQHCGASFTQKSILKLHVNGVHDKLKPFKCEDCQASFTLEYTLDHHIKAVHDKLKPFKCSDCDFACLKKVDLQIHEFQEHQQTTFSCEICGLCFPQKVDLQFHMSGQHQLKKFGCNFCQERFAHEAYAKYHMTYAHSTNSVQK